MCGQPLSDDTAASSGVAAVPNWQSASRERIRAAIAVVSFGDMSVRLPKTVGKYQVLDRLAVGGMAEIFKARALGDHGFERLVVIKRILPHLAGDRAFVDMFIDEARITARLDHPGIVQVYELGNDGGTPFIAMQFVDGIDVLGLLREGARSQVRLPAELAVYIAHQVLDALDFAHHAVDGSGAPIRIVHRDISPGNVLVSRRGDVKLTDFGIARAAERKYQTEAGVLKGKYGYMSPEQVQGAELDARSDVFSAGVVLAEMVIARRLFAGPGDFEVLLQVREASLDRLDKYARDIPIDLRPILDRALARDRDARWASAAEMRDALGDWLHTRRRIGRRDLSAFVERVMAAPTAPDLDAMHDEGGTLTGPSTRMHVEKALAEVRAARAEFIAGGAVDRTVRDESSSGIVVVEETDHDPSQTVPTRLPPMDSGDFRQVSPIRLFYRLARERATGLLVLEGRAGILKEAHLDAGHPQFVSSNVQSELLGEFLVREGVISSKALARALTVMPRFDGRLLDTLVGLGLLRPLDAARLLGKQVTAKLIEVYSWPKGKYQWYPGRENPNPTRPLHLDAYRVIGAGAAVLDVALVDEWADGVAKSLIVAESATAADLGAFGLGETVARVHARLDGTAAVGELVAKVRSPDARTNFLRLLYLLVQTGMARLA